MRLLIVPDKFKGTLGAEDVARAIASGWRRVRPMDALQLLPMSDGGDGFGPVIGKLLKAQTRSVRTLDAAHRPRIARWWWAEKGRTAILETAQSNGLAQLQDDSFHPFELDTFGIGRLVEAATKAGARTCLLGVGGSATNDGGFGLATALGWQFLDRQVRSIARWTELDRLVRIVPPVSKPSGCEFIVATDVSNPLLGRNGASRIYGPQKGLSPGDIRFAESRLRRLAQVVRLTLGFDSRQAGCGAAGGLGFGLQAFLQARQRLGFDLFAELADLERRIARVDAVITGEGSLDASTLMGKGVGQLLRLCARHRKSVFAIAGRVNLGRLRHEGLVMTESLVELAGDADAMKRTWAVLKEAAARIAARLK